MKIECNHCGKSIEYATAAPDSCEWCGRPLREDGAGKEFATTRAFDQHALLANDDGAITQVGGYRIVRELGRGGMGVVYEAEQHGTGRRVALKLLPRDMAYTEASVKRFLTEGQRAASVSHPRSTFVYGAGQDNGQFYIAMELMTGGTLQDLGTFPRGALRG